MLVKTRKYALSKKRYLRLVYVGFLQKHGIWILLAYALLNAGVFLWPSWWWAVASTVALLLYLLFWLLQFKGVTYLEQFKMFFERLSYEIDSRQIMIKLSAREGMPVPWTKIKRARMGNDGFVFYLNVAQIIHIPFKVFHSDHEIKVVETLLRRKQYIP